MAINNRFNTNDLNPNKLNSNKTDDDCICHLKFEFCHNKYPIEKLSSKDLKSMLSYFQKVENMTWKEIKVDHSLNYEVPKKFNHDMSNYVPQDATASSMRATGKFRIIGWRQANYYNILWFDKNHESYNG